ncbi:MAG: helix-turn-helix domain-containing protein [Deltaproteobacteria bacterium]|nr:helix-turn-helix domain-containing protein [Deltaproteobacteria bacterium]
MDSMASKNKTTQPPLMIGDGTFGQRLCRIRKEKGYTQVQLAEKLGIIQVLISDYERDKLRPYNEMIVRFARALDVSSDELLGLRLSKKKGNDPSLKLIRWMQKTEDLPLSQQKVLLRTIDTFLKRAAK